MDETVFGKGPAASGEETCLAEHVSPEDTAAYRRVVATAGLGSPHLILFGSDLHATRSRAVERALTLGRADDNDLALPTDRSASRRHARVARRGDHLVVEDLGSRNGTFVDGQRVTRADLRDGSLLRVGDTLARVAWLSESFAPATTEGPFVGGSSLAPLRRLASLLGPTTLPLLILGETGTGKEVFARLVHGQSARRGPFIAVNCAALPVSLVESELFGYVRGAFTGASDARKGLFSAASGGTLFLDEVGDLPLAAQATLLRVLEDGMVRPVGSESARRVDVRVLSATNRDLRRAVSDQTFRADLLARLGSMEATMPPLRDRPADLPALMAYLRRRADQPPLTVAVDALEAMALYSWPQNLRELDNLLRQVALELPAAGGCIELPLLPPRIRAALDGARQPRSGRSLTAPNELHAAIEHALALHHGNVRQASRSLGFARSHVYRLLKRWRIEPENFRLASGTAVALPGAVATAPQRNDPERA